MSVTLLAYLRHLVDCFTNAEFCANGEGVKLDALCGEVFCKLACAKSVDAILFHLGNGLHSKKTYLTMPVSCMGITYDAVVNTALNCVNGVFCFAFLFTDVYCNDFHIIPSQNVRFCHRLFQANGLMILSLICLLLSAYRIW